MQTWNVSYPSKQIVVKQDDDRHDIVKDYGGNPYEQVKYTYRIIKTVGFFDPNLRIHKILLDKDIMKLIQQGYELIIT